MHSLSHSGYCHLTDIGSLGIQPLTLHNQFLTTFFSAIRYVISQSRGKKILKFSLVPRASTSKFLLVLLPNNLSLSRKNRLSVNFLLVHRTLGENICLSCLKFNLSRAPGQVIFLPLQRYFIMIKTLRWAVISSNFLES